MYILEPDPMTANETTWKITEKKSAARFVLKNDGAMRAEFEVEDEGRPLVTVEFSSLGRATLMGADAYARAEAARLYAQILDTVGDMQVTGERLDFTADDVTLDGPLVEVWGSDAVIAVAAFFGDDLCNEVA